MSDPVPATRPFGQQPASESSVQSQSTSLPGLPERNSWFHKLSSLLFIVFCFELGLFLLVYPWISAWGDNYFAWAVPQSFQKTWNVVWNNAYLRGAVSGLGIANVWIAIVEIFRLFRRT